MFRMDENAMIITSWAVWGIVVSVSHKYASQVRHMITYLA